jgi:hypothetical protein
MVEQKSCTLVLLDLGGTLFYRLSVTRSDLKDTQTPSFVIGHYEYYMRPGYTKFLSELKETPGINLGFYSSITRKNILPILEKIGVDKNVPIFDNSYCPLMSTHEVYKCLRM